jgi:Ca2+-binding RTX toxin-like protein
MSQEGVNRLDGYFKQHDQAYESATDPADFHAADLALIDHIKGIFYNPDYLGELAPIDRLYAQLALYFFEGTAFLENTHAFLNPLNVFKGDPLVLDLAGDGIELSSLNASTVHFDYAGDGFAERTGWGSANDGILAIDDNDNGLIDNGLELFGSSTQDGFAVLEKLDANGDGKIDAQDADFGKLRVWSDLNQNGVSENGELQSLSQAGISSISLSRQAINGINAGNTIGYEAQFTRADATHGVTQSIYFQTDRQDSIADNTPTFTPAEGVALLPQLRGSGTIGSMAYKASLDASFRTAWTELTDNAAKMTPAELRAAFESVLLEWAGVTDINPESRGPYVDARHLAFVEAFFGESYREIQRGVELRSYPSSQSSGANVEASFEQIFNVLELTFLAQTVGSVVMRGNAEADLIGDSPYLYFLFLKLGPQVAGEPAPETPGNVGAVLDLILSTPQPDQGTATEYLIKALSALNGMIDVAFGGDRQAYAAVIEPHLAVITDDTIRDIATHIVDGTALFGTTHAEGMNGTSGDDVVIGDGGGDVVSGGAGSEIYVYGKHDGDLWIKDDGAAAADTDRLVLTNLNSANVSLDRIGDTLLIKVTETGKTVTVEQFFANHGIEILRFADGTEWDRSQIKNATVYRGDGHNNFIHDSDGDDVIHGAQGDDLIHIGGGNDTILYGKGDGYDIVDDSSTSPTEHDKFVLTDLNPEDIQLSRAGSHLILTVKATGEYVDFTNFFPGNTGDWDTTARNIDAIKFANGTSWNRAEIQNNAWYRGSDHGDTISASELNDTIEGGKGDDVLDGWSGSDTYIWKKGDGNDQISDFSSIFFPSTASNIDTLCLTDVTSGEVSFSYQGSTLLISINSSGETITVPNFFGGVASLLTGAGAYGFGIDAIKFADGGSLDRQEITHRAGLDYLGWDRTTFTYVVNGFIEWSYFTDEFNHGGNIIGGIYLDTNDVWNASSYGGLGGIFGVPDFLQPKPFDGSGKNTLVGGDGNDILGGGAAQDVLSGGQGNDVLYGDYRDENLGDGNDVLNGGDGNDAIYGGPGMDLMDGGEGNDYLFGGAGKDYMSGWAGDDVYVGGKGDDVLISNNAFATGNDTFIYSSGDGNDVIFESGSGYSGAASETDTLVLTDLTPEDVEFSRSVDDLLIRIKSTGEVITVSSHFFDRLPDNNTAGMGIELIRFSDGKEWDRQKIHQAAWFRGTDGRDVLNGTMTNAQLDDTFDGGKGNDVIKSGAGSNTFVYASGDGNDVIFDETLNTFAQNSFDKLKFINLNASEVRLERSGDDLLIKTLATGEVITIVSQFARSLSAPDEALELIQFADGEEWGREKIQQEAWYRGTDGRDFIQLSGWNDTVEGGKGDDTIYSGYQGGSGSDTFVYSKGDGNDFLREETWHSFSSTEIDALKLKDIDSGDIQLSRSGSDLLVKIVPTNETITVSHQFSDSADAPGQGLEYIQFANGDQWGRETILGIVTNSAPFIAGGNGNDTLVGSSATQNIYGEAGNDTIDGQGGSDLLYGGQGNDTFLLSVSAPGDLITVNGSVGTDTVDLTNFGAAVWVDLVTNGAEVRTTDQNDLTSGAWRDVAQVEQMENVTGTAFADQISGDAGNNILIGGGGGDTLDGRSGDDTLIGGAGNDSLTGGMGADWLDGSDGSDTLSGGIGMDTLIGGSGDDMLTGGADWNVFVFGGSSGADIITDFVAGSGTNHDLIKLDRSVYPDYASVLAASTQVGSDVLISDSNGNTITLLNVDLASLIPDNFEFRRLDNQAPTTISVEGGTVAENAAAGTVIATLTPIDAGDAGPHTFSIVGGDDLFEIVGNQVRVKDGAVVDFEAASQHTLNVKATDDDGLSFTSSMLINIADQIETQTGTAANDVLIGGAGADVLVGGAGNDRLVGAGGSDEYQYALGDGDDRIVDAGNASDVDQLVLGTGIDASSVIVGRASNDNSDAVLLFANGTAIVLQDQLSGSAGVGLEEIRFADNSTWGRADILNHLDVHLMIGTSQNGVLAGSEAADTFVAGTGDQTFSGHGGTDTYRIGPGAGHDLIVEGYGAGTDRIQLVGLNSGDVQFSSIGNDLVIKILSTGSTTTVVNQFDNEGEGVEEIVFADGTVWDRSQIVENGYIRGTSAGDTIVGTAGNDVLLPGLGNDLIQSGAGSDTIIYALGDGSDTVNDGVNAATQVDVLRFVDLNADDVLLSRQGADLSIAIISSGEFIKVVGQFTSPAAFWGIEQIQFADGTLWSKAQISAAAWILGTSSAETLNGTSDPDRIDGQGGDDSLRGANGGDTYIYRAGSGNDTIYENSGDDGTDLVKLVGLTSSDVEFSRSGSDLLIRILSSGETLKVDSQFNGTSGIEQVAFADGSTWNRSQIFDASWVRGTSGNDIIWGGSDAEVFDGQGGDDSLFGQGGGDTYIYGVGSGNDTVKENSTDAGTDVIKLVGLNSPDVLFSRSGNDLLLKTNSSGETLRVVDQFNGTNGIEQVMFADGSTWNRVQITDASPIRGTSGADNIWGGADPEVFDGQGGDDSLFGQGGGDTYIYGVGSGNDTVKENSTDAGTDVIKLVGLNSSEVLFSRSGNDLLIKINSSGELLKVVDQFNGTNGIEQVTFADGSTWDRGQITDASPIRGTSGDDSIWGGADAEVFDGQGGNDTLRGQGGGDTYIYGVGSGNDIVDESSSNAGTDVIKLVGLDSSNLLFSRSGNDLLIKINSSGETLKVLNQFNGTNGIEQVRFADGSAWDRGQITDASPIRGTSGDDSIWGGADPEVFDGQGGNDTLRGQGGGDTYIYGVGSGNDIVDESSSNAGTDVIKLVGLNSSNLLFSRSGNDLLIQINSSGETMKVLNQFNGTNGIEQISFADGSSWNRSQIYDAAWIRGTSGDDSIWGGADAEVFDGQGGNDTLRGQGSGDTYIYGVGSGNDIVDESSSNAGTDVIKLVGLNSSNLLFSRSGNDLLIQISSSGETMKVLNQFDGTNGIEQVAFADGSSWNRSQIFDASWVRGTSGDDSIWGGGDAEVFDGRGGNDTLRGQGSGDTYIYGVGSGNDIVDESSSNAGTDVIKLVGLNTSDVLFSRSGNDLLIQISSSGETMKVLNQFDGTNGIEQVSFADGTIWDRSQMFNAAWIRGTSGNDTLIGSSWNDTFLGGLGNDLFSSGPGSDTYIYASGDGNDYINDESGSTSDIDVLHLIDLNVIDLTFSRSGVNLIATVNSNGQTITFDEQFYSQTANWGLEKIEFADGSNWDLATINSNAWIRGTSGNDTLAGSSWNDTIAGGAGNDTLSGGAGNDVFVFRSGFGQDTITDFSVGHDVVEFRDGIFADSAAAFAAATASGSNTIITIDASTTVLLQNVALANLHVDDFRAA